MMRLCLASTHAIWFYVQFDVNLQSAFFILVILSGSEDDLFITY